MEARYAGDGASSFSPVSTAPTARIQGDHRPGKISDHWLSAILLPCSLDHGRCAIVVGRILQLYLVRKVIGEYQSPDDYGDCQGRTCGWRYGILCITKTALIDHGVGRFG